MDNFVFGLYIFAFLASGTASAFNLAYGNLATTILLAVYAYFFGAIAWKIAQKEEKQQGQ